MRRLTLIAALVAIAAAGPAHAQKPEAENPVTAENAREGTTRWDLTPPPRPAIEGYASEASVAPGDAFHLHVRAPAADRYRILVSRRGGYGGEGGRLVTCLPGCDADQRAAPQPAAPQADPGT